MCPKRVANHFGQLPQATASRPREAKKHAKVFWIGCKFCIAQTKIVNDLLFDCSIYYSKAIPQKKPRNPWPIILILKYVVVDYFQTAYELLGKSYNFLQPRRAPWNGDHGIVCSSRWDESVSRWTIELQMFRLTTTPWTSLGPLFPMRAQRKFYRFAHFFNIRLKRNYDMSDRWTDQDCQLSSARIQTEILWHTNSKTSEDNPRSPSS